MSAIVKPPKRASLVTHQANIVSAPRPRSRYEKQQRAQLQVVSSAPVRSRSQAVQMFPNVRSQPEWLIWLATIQRGSTLITFSLVTAVLAVYSWTVYAQAAFGREYRRLENYQALERRLTPAIESLKDWLATQAESPESGLVLPSASSAIFLEPASQRPPNAVSETDPLLPAQPSLPIGY